MNRMSMSAEEFLAWKAESEKRYALDVQRELAKLREPTDPEKAVIAVQFPGWRTNPETLMDVKVNARILDAVAEIIAALKPWWLADHEKGADFHARAILAESKLREIERVIGEP